MDIQELRDYLTHKNPQKVTINGEKVRVALSNDGRIMVMQPNSRKQGYIQTEQMLSTWKVITVHTTQQPSINKRINACIALIITPPPSHSRALDKYFEDKDANIIAQGILERARKNPNGKLRKALTQYGWDWFNERLTTEVTPC